MTGFWSSETMRRRIRAEYLVVPYEEDLITNCAYELRMGSNAHVTGERENRQSLEAEQQLRIPPGHFAQLETKEVVRVPPDSLGLISIKSGLKRGGLVNVSGFHVDPGFHGPLVFSVYNAGPSDVVLSRGTPTFLVWFASLDNPTSDLYTGNRQHSGLTDEDVMRMQGEVFTPHVLADRIVDLDREVDRRVSALERTIGWRDKLWFFVITALISFVLGILAPLACPKRWIGHRYETIEDRSE